MVSREAAATAENLRLADELANEVQHFTNLFVNILHAEDLYGLNVHLDAYLAARHQGGGMSHGENPASDKRARPVAEAAWNVIREIAGEGTWDRRQCAEAAAYFAYLQGVAAGREAEVAARASEEVVALMKVINERDEAREAYEMLVEMHYQRVGELVNERDAARAALRTTKEETDG